MPKPSATSPSTLFMGAWSYKNAMGLLLPKLYEEGSHHLRAPFAMLNGFALELALKSVLRARGSSDEHLRVFRHDLQKAQAEVIRRGIIWSQPKSVDDLIAIMTKPHRDLSMRYIPAGVAAIPLPPPDGAFSTTELMLDDIERQEPIIAIEMPGED